MIMGTIQGIARFKIQPENLKEFKRLSAECVRLAREKDSGTLRYELFFNDDQTECIVHEEYVDSESLIRHFQNMGDNAAELFAITEISGEIWGDPSPELRESLKGQNILVFLPYLTIAE